MTNVESYGKDLVGYIDTTVRGKTHFENEIVVVSIIVGVITAILTYPFYLNPFFHLSGLLSFFVHKGYNNFTRERLIRVMEDKRFHEYGIEEHARSHWDLPTNSQIAEFRSDKTKRNEIIAAIIFTLLPPVAFARLSVTWFNYRRNTLNFERLDKSMEFGDQVKQKLKSGNEQNAKKFVRKVCIDGICREIPREESALSV
jgi:hypothetical protein